MNQQPDERPVEARADPPPAARSSDPPTLPEDLLLLLFQPEQGVIAGENTLFYALAGAVLADLALQGSVAARRTRAASIEVEAVQGKAPSDEILRSAWTYLSDGPRGVQSVLPAIGPTLRQPVLDRLLARGDMREEKRRVLTLFHTTVLKDGRDGRRAGLLKDVRDVLVDGEEPTARTAALAALIWGSGTLHLFDPGIPWNSSVINRARELEQGNWGAGATGEAVARTMTAAIVNNVIGATASVSPQQ
ncbi:MULTISPECIES: GOLPH3/VPS74 family protein [unclassified Streptomyces]|uniref:GOLPH3/VPS74 family protein n=1 Tax=unclassified Streptomyces TaxID=2593676 RepID=UPI001E606F26|nr:MULTISPECIES: GPP34 family phosphoprotein [unclassified Streptomyces]MDU0304104.1 GPP34 family phosphoprotein [Streptomyces sp. PAL114]